MNIKLLPLTILVVLSLVSCGYCASSDASFLELESALKNKGVSRQFIQAVAPSVKKMLLCQARPAEVEMVLLDLWKEGVKGRALTNALAAVAELVKSGDNTLDAARIASGAAHKAESEGLNGFMVGMRVKKAVEERKAFLKKGIQ